MSRIVRFPPAAPPKRRTTLTTDRAQLARRALTLLQDLPAPAAMAWLDYGEYMRRQHAGDRAPRRAVAGARARRAAALVAGTSLATAGVVEAVSRFGTFEWMMETLLR